MDHYTALVETPRRIREHLTDAPEPAGEQPAPMTDHSPVAATLRRRLSITLHSLARAIEPAGEPARASSRTA